jgi:hypothetical protein
MQNGLKEWLRATGVVQHLASKQGPEFNSQCHKKKKSYLQTKERLQKKPALCHLGLGLHIIRKLISVV